MSTVNLVFIPFPMVSHLTAAVKIATLLADRHPALTATVLLMKLNADDPNLKNSHHSRVNFIHLPYDHSRITELKKDPKNFIFGFVDSQKEAVRAAVTRLPSNSGKVAGFVLDMFCSALIDVANEFSVPSYLCYTSGSASLGLVFHAQSLRDDRGQDLTAYNRPGVTIPVPTFLNPVPSESFPPSILEKEGDEFLNHFRKFRETKGIISNTFLELEAHAITSFSNDNKLPPVFPIGPMLDQSDEDSDKKRDIISCLNDQPDLSVVFLCFGSNGAFQKDQVMEIARALENCGHRFLWSLRKPASKQNVDGPVEYGSIEQVLPEGFLQRTKGVGKVIGWAPQMAVLSHRAVGGFVSHCGWNSTLESVWCGVPMAVWPLAAEQQANAFQMVKELEIAEEIKLDYRKDCGVLVEANVIEKAIGRLMDPENVIREKVKGLQLKSRNVLMEGGSSYDSVGHFVQHVMGNII